MHHFRHLRIVIVSLFLLYLLSSRVAYAYLDPGTGSYILQLIIGFLFGALFTVKIYWRKVKTFFVKSFLKKSQNVKKGND